MAASFNESQKLDYLWKKIGYGVAKTSIPPPGSGSKEAFNESIASPLLYRGDLVWAQSGSIPAVPPSDTSSIVQVYKDGGGAGYSPTVECTEDLTAPDNQTWKTNLTNWIPTQFGDNYLVQVYVANASVSNPQTVGTRLFQAGSGSDDTWFFDYQAGVLNFNGATIPSVITGGVSGKSVYIVGYRYVGEFGVGSGNSIGNLTINNTTIGTVAANANIVLNPTGTGLVTIDTVTGLVLPVGNTVQRPAPGTTGTIRYNNSLSYVEYYNGSSWVEVGGGGTSNVSVSDQQITPDGTSVTYTLDQETNQVSILVAINGIGQIPGSSYSVTGNLITFSEAPLTTDIIDIRFLATAATRDKILNGTGNTFVQATDSSTVVFNIASSNVVTVSTSGASVVGNVTGNYFIGNGSQLTGIGTSSYSNANVVALLSAFGSNSISTTGNITAANINSSNSDLAEMYAADRQYAPGTVLSFGGSAEVTQASLDADPAVAGIVSTQPAYCMNLTINSDYPVALALMGRVPCLVQGPVSAGALMVAAGNGRARAESSPAMGTVIGKAVESFAGTTGMIEVVVGRV